MGTSGPSLTVFEQHAQARIEANDDAAVVESAVAFHEHALLPHTNRLYIESHILVQLVSGAQGACFMQPEELSVSALDGVVGKRASQLLRIVPNNIKIAILDALFANLNAVDGVSAEQSFEFDGPASRKSRERASAIVAASGVDESTKLLVVGAVFDIVKLAQERGADVRVADRSIAGTEVAGVTVQNDARPIVEWANTLLITGNALQTGTLGELVTSAKTQGKKTVVYAMTAANIAARYVDHGVDVVTTESFPYYWYANVSSRLNVYKAKP